MSARSDYRGQTIGYLEIGDYHGQEAGENTLYLARRTCCGVVSVVSQRQITAVANAHRERCAECWATRRTEICAATKAARAARPRPALITTRMRPAVAAAVAERRAATQERLNRIAVGLLPTPPTGPIRGPADLLIRHRERAALARARRLAAELAADGRG